MKTIIKYFGCAAVCVGTLSAIPAASAVAAEEMCQVQIEAIEKAWIEGAKLRIESKYRHNVQNQLRQAKEYCQQGNNDEAIHYLEVVRSQLKMPATHDHKKG